MPILEIAAGTVDEAQKAVEGGAASLEICVDLAAGGLTPPLELVRAIREEVSVTLNVMIRVRAGDFVYTTDEMDAMLGTVADVKKILLEKRAVHPTGRLRTEAPLQQMDGIVFGALTADGDVNLEQMQMVVEAASPLPVTLHRALDVCRTPDDALRGLAGRVKRVLTSGPAPTAWEGREIFKRWVETYGQQYRFAVSGGITLEQLPELVRTLGADEYHIGGAARTNGVVDVAKVRQLREIIGD